MTRKITSKSTVDAPNMKMPVVGLGTWQASSDEEVENALTVAIEAGYRHIDTAYVYMNEGAIGKSLEKLISSGKVKREELFIVTKLPTIANRPEYVETYLNKSLEALKLSYIDLYLIHHPVGMMHGDGTDTIPKGPDGELLLDYEVNHIELWKAMEKQVENGKVKAIGVSNFNCKQLNRLVENSKIKPANNQVEMHVYLQQRELVDYCKKHDVTICAYAPLGSPALRTFTEAIGFSLDGLKELSPMTDPTVVEIAKKYGKSSSHVLLRFLVQMGVAVIPKSSNPTRIKQNIDIFDFELNEEDMSKLLALDKGAEGRMFEKGLFASMAKHPEYPF